MGLTLSADPTPADQALVRLCIPLLLVLTAASPLQDMQAKQISSALICLHGLRLNERSRYKLYMLVHKRCSSALIHHGQNPYVQSALPAPVSKGAACQSKCHIAQPCIDCCSNSKIYAHGFSEHTPRDRLDLLCMHQFGKQKCLHCSHACPVAAKRKECASFFLLGSHSHCCRLLQLHSC